MVLGDLDSCIQKNETGSPTYTIHKNKYKVIKDFNISHDTIKDIEENIGRKIPTFHAAMSSLICLLKQGT